MTWYCRCQEIPEDDAGGPGVCRAAARIVQFVDQISTSGVVLVCYVRCDAGHRYMLPFVDIDLLA